MTDGAEGAGGAGPTGGAGFAWDTGSNEASGVEDKGCASLGFPDR